MVRKLRKDAEAKPPARATLSREETLERMEGFEARAEAIVAKVRKASRGGDSPERMKLSAEESLKRVQEFDQRKEQFIAAVRKGKN